MMNSLPLHLRLASIFVVGLGLALLTTVAGTNIFVLLLLLTVPWAWAKVQLEGELRQQTLQFFGLVATICVWSMIPNLIAGHDATQVVKALLHDMRTFGFIVLLWPLFTNVTVSRAGLWALLAGAVVLATTNLLLTLSGYVEPGKYFWPTGPHLYGQVLVGFIFLLAQMLLVRPALSWRVALPILLLVLSLFLASVRRTGYLQLAFGFVLWVSLNHRRLLVGKYRWWVLVGAIVAFAAALSAPIVQRRMAEVVSEVYLFMSQSAADRVTKETAVGIRLQYYISVWQLITQSNWWTGVGSIDFIELFWQVNQQLGATEKTLFSNPHNEYLYTLATKGVVGLLLYVAIFAQACRMALRKADEVQRIGLLVFVSYSC